MREFNGAAAMSTTNPLDITINHGPSGGGNGEYSDWAAAAVVIYNCTITASQIAQVCGAVLYASARRPARQPAGEVTNSWLPLAGLVVGPWGVPIARHLWPHLHLSFSITPWTGAQCAYITLVTGTHLITALSSAATLAAQTLAKQQRPAWALRRRELAWLSRESSSTYY